MAMILRKEEDGTYHEGDWPKEYNFSPVKLTEFIIEGYATVDSQKNTVTFKFKDGQSKTYNIVDQRTNGEGVVQEYFTVLKGGK